MPAELSNEAKAELERYTEALNQCRMVFAGFVSTRSAVDMIDALGDNRFDAVKRDIELANKQGYARGFEAGVSEGQAQTQEEATYRERERCAKIIGNWLGEDISPNSLGYFLAKSVENTFLKDVGHEVFFAALDNPPEPTDALKAAFVRLTDELKR